ncbi:MAG TPA: hypothetical protein VLW25_00110 [Bryobacteraceae bacterium]|nr:hypothetical protein [Bryobacteraceae bacterium]
MSNDHANARRAHLPASVFVLLLLGLALALAGNVYQFVKSQRLARDLAAIQHNLQAQITRLSDATSGAFDVAERRFEELKRLQDSTAAAIIDARSELRHSNSQVATRLEDRNQELAQRNQELAAQLTALKQDIAARLQSTAARLQNTSTKLDTADAKLQHVFTETDRNRADLKKVAVDLNAVTAKLATTAKTVTTLPQPPATPPQLPARKHLPFDLLTTKVPTRIGEIQIAIRSTDPKNNRYSMDLYTGDKVARGKDCAVNEAVQFYLSGNPLPYEVVVNQVWKDEVIGYVSAPNHPAQAAATARNNASPAGTR